MISRKVRRLEESFEREHARQEDICNPRYHNISYCLKYNSNECKGTCNYARKMEKMR